MPKTQAPLPPIPPIRRPCELMGILVPAELRPRIRVAAARRAQRVGGTRRPISEFVVEAIERHLEASE